MKKKYKYKKILLVISILAMIMSQTALADNNDFCSGTWTNSDDLSVQRFTSANDFSSYIDANWDAWNYIDSNLEITSSHYNIYNNDGGHDIRFYGDDLATAYGTALNYKKNWLGYPVPSWTGTWVKSIITLDTTSGSSGLLGKGDDFCKKVVIHELGHAIALDHPESSGHSSTDAIMKSGDNGYYDVQQHDEDNIKAKW